MSIYNNIILNGKKTKKCFHLNQEWDKGIHHHHSYSMQC
jgi:hypothetical protein